ncbi:hypothetical protein P692DRAFT_20878659 [Suillus brevipes Sb2]|nr:hypothetical protein P692DRAFT_20878659 [Suillus brevipes Sb2]
MPRALVWCDCTRCSVTERGRLQQTRKTRQRHQEADLHDREHQELLRAREEAEEHFHVPIAPSKSNSQSLEPADSLPDSQNQYAIDDEAPEPYWDDAELDHLMDLDD